MNREHLIGVVGGLGPQAGLDLVSKLHEETVATSDREHLPVALLSVPGTIADRIAFLNGSSTDNPARGIVEAIRRLAELGAGPVGIACNTAHAHAIFSVVERQLEAAHLAVDVLHMIREVTRELQTAYAGVTRVGILGTLGAYGARIYEQTLEPEGFTVVVPEPAVQHVVHGAIYDPATGIKAQFSPVTGAATDAIRTGIDALAAGGAEAVVLGCTELPLVITEREIDGVPMVDPSRILARALIREFAPAKLREQAPQPKRPVM